MLQYMYVQVPVTATHILQVDLSHLTDEPEAHKGDGENSDHNPVWELTQ